MAGKRAAKGLGSVYKEEVEGRSTRWVAEKWVTLPTGRKRRVRARAATQDAALAALTRKAARIIDANPDAERQTVADFMATWLTHKEAHVRASSLRAYRQDDRLYITKHLGKLRLARVQARDCQDLVDKIANAGAKSMADRVRRTLKQAFGQAVKWGLLPANPMNQVSPVRRPEPKRGTYDLEQIRAFLAAAAGSKYHPLFLLAFSTGARKGELLALKWSDVEPGGVHIRRTVSHSASGDGTTPPKTKAGVRFIPVPPTSMRRVLETRTPHARDDDWVFTTRNGKRHSTRSISRAMRRIQERHGLPEIRFHDFRRSYATLLAVQGHHPRVIQALLGHSTPTLAMTIYTEATDAAKREAYVDVNTGGLNGGRATGRERTASEPDKRDGPLQGAKMEA